MTDRHPDQRMPEWEACPLKQRLLDCLTQLAIDQMVTQAEKARIVGRIRKWVDTPRDPLTVRPVKYADHDDTDPRCGCASCMGVA